MTYAAFALVALLALVLIYQYTLGSSARQTMERFSDSSSMDTLVLMYMNGCGWCEKLMPTWDRFADMQDGKGVVFKKYEAKEAGGAKYKHHVTGYPTILLVKGSSGAIVKFEGERSIDGMRAFLQENGVHIVERFARRVEGGAAKMLKNAGNTVKKNNQSGEEHTKSIGNKAGMNLKEEEAKKSPALKSRATS